MKLLRKLLFPFSLLYLAVTSIRNFLYNTGVFKSQDYTKPIIVVGNLNTGGTGKSPMIMLLIESLSNLFEISVLSRGYKRKTKGYIELNTQHTADEVGDEPLQFKTNFPKVPMAVCADRRYGISQLIDRSDAVLLDDAYQHRKVKGSFNILLTSYGDLFCDDYILPVGNLRESRSGAKRADCMVVTKCPINLADNEKNTIRRKLQKYNSVPVYFASIAYADEIRSETNKEPITSLKDKPFTLVTGIANPKPLLAYLDKKGFTYNHKAYPDHHPFSDKELEELRKETFILTTEKDYMRLQGNLSSVPLYYLPIKTIIQEEQDVFIKAVVRHIQTYDS
ncbi:MAG TPA: tetraacyldisaccharide 4'-kinase [Flavobacteriaceae bacterium]|nr:tetraacyldisaccharide 4'-kinase [Flavobacteriaceae bacterium]